MSIPKIIHQFWTPSLTTHDIPEEELKSIASWEKTHPDFIRITWSMKSLSIFLEDFYGLKLLTCIECCRFPAMQSDLIRLAVLYAFGGFWNDLKNQSNQPFLYHYLEHDKLILAEHWPMKTPGKYPHRIANGFIGAPEKNSLIWKWLKQAEENISKRQQKGTVGLTGAGVIMKIINNKERHDYSTDYMLIPHQLLWKGYIKRSSGSYNNAKQHWSIRQQSESPYLY